MSRSKQSSRGGWIEITGFRFFQRVAGNSVSRKELVELIRGFFTDRGLKFSLLEVRFRATQRPHSSEGGGMWGHTQFSGGTGKGLVEIFVSTVVPMDPSDLWDTLGHELDHVAWSLQGREFDSSLPYMARPHEKRAFSTGPKWARMVERKFGF